MGLHRHDVTLRSTALCALCLSDIHTYIHTYIHTSISGTLHYLHHSSNRAVNYITCWCDRMKLHSLITKLHGAIFHKTCNSDSLLPKTVCCGIYLHLAARNWLSCSRYVDGTKHLNDITGHKHLTTGTEWQKNWALAADGWPQKT
jgi:hypothetical protein